MTNVKQLPNLHLNQKINKPTSLYENPSVPDPYKKIAKGMERQFINHMINEMQKTVHSSEPQSAGTKYYKSLLADERSKIMANVDNGIGLKEVILEQIVPDHLKNTSNKYNAIQMYRENKVQGENL
ncbi:MAG: rod-binding protein [Bacteriovoracaceae bacterium]|jgi:Rod binding domain-containing protein|nr:rod-binding protein [Bacteriovoracaceae bacterium]